MEQKKPVPNLSEAYSDLKVKYITMKGYYTDKAKQVRDRDERIEELKKELEKKDKAFKRLQTSFFEKVSEVKKLTNAVNTMNFGLTKDNEPF